MLGIKLNHAAKRGPEYLRTAPEEIYTVFAICENSILTQIKSQPNISDVTHAQAH